MRIQIQILIKNKLPYLEHIFVCYLGRHTLVCKQDRTGKVFNEAADHLQNFIFVRF